MKTIIRNSIKTICEYCKKDKTTVKNRPTRNGTCDYCEECYEIQILMS